LVDLAERTNPDTRAAWDAARAAAAAVGLAESAYLPQLSLQAIAGYEHTPFPAPKNLVPEGYFVSKTKEVIPTLALKWLLFDFGRRDAQLEAARADSFVANVAFTGAHQKLIFDVTQAYFGLGAARGNLPPPPSKIVDSPPSSLWHRHSAKPPKRGTCWRPRKARRGQRRRI
jgi:outer membrane protein TolC